MPRAKQKNALEQEPLDLSPLERIAKLDAERNQIINAAKTEALEKVEKAIAELNSLGFDYVISDRAHRHTAPSGNGAKRQTKDAPCPICVFKTNPLHDARSHRQQEPKRPFTADELVEKGFTRVA